MEKGDFIVVCNAADLRALRTFWMGDNPRQREAYQVISAVPLADHLSYALGVGQIPAEAIDQKIKDSIEEKLEPVLTRVEGLCACGEMPSNCRDCNG